MFVADLAHLCVEALIQLVEYGSDPGPMQGRLLLVNTSVPGRHSGPEAESGLSVGWLAPIIFLEDCYKRYVGLVQLNQACYSL
jgi:hypothetical protein